MEKSVIPTD